MSFNLKLSVLITSFYSIVFFPNIKSDCLIKYTNNIDIAPKFEKVMGKFKIRVPFGGYDSHIIKLQNGEDVHGSCETYFSPIVYETKERTPSYDYYNRYETSYKKVQKTISNQTAFVFKCRDAALFYNDYKLLDQQLSCLEQSWSIYSTQKPYGWCENNQNSTTFIFAAQKSNEQNILAGVCYNIDQMSLQTLVYNTTTLHHNSLNNPMNENNVISSEYLEENLWNFKTSIVSDLSENVLEKKLSELSKTHDWLSLATYELSLIAQEELLMKYFKGYESILNIIWWRNLRIGNWKRFQKALTNYADNNSYELYIGASGVAQYPTDDQCDKERYLEINLGSQNEIVPAYIWTYLKSNDNLNKEFVMVGFNSPYAEYFTTEKVIFCPDICAEIPWLKSVSPSFRYAYAGIMFCCSTDFIRQTNYLEGFPIEILLTQQIITTVGTTTTTIADFTTEDVTDVYTL